VVGAGEGYDLPMPRQARLDFPGALQHVMVRGVARGRIYDDAGDREKFLVDLGSLLEPSGMQCLAWALLPNHVHLLVRTGKWPLKRVMQRLLIRYAMYYNRRHKRSGHLFQNRYKSILCEEDAYLRELIRYIHLNPLRAGQVRTYGELANHRWCGHGAILGKRQVKWQETEGALEAYGKQRTRARNAYDEYVRDGVGKGRREEFSGGGLIGSLGGFGGALRLQRRREQQHRDERILGSGEYVAEVLREVERRDRRQARVRDGLKPEQVVARAADALGVEAGLVYGRRKLQRVSLARSLASKWLVDDLGLSVGAAARMLKVTPAAVCYGVRKGRDVEANCGAKLGI